MKAPWFYLSQPYRDFADAFSARNPDIAFIIAQDGPEAFYVGFALMLDLGTVRQIGETGKNPDSALLLAYASLGMNFNRW